MVLQMKPRKIGTKGIEAPWLEFTVYSQSKEGEYSEHCSGLLQVQYSSDTNEEERETEAAVEWESFQSEYANVQQICTDDQTPEYFYDDLVSKKRNMYYGKSCYRESLMHHLSNTGALYTPHFIHPSMRNRTDGGKVALVLLTCLS